MIQALQDKESKVCTAAWRVLAIGFNKFEASQLDDAFTALIQGAADQNNVLSRIASNIFGGASSNLKTDPLKAVLAAVLQGTKNQYKLVREAAFKMLKVAFNIASKKFEAEQLEAALVALIKALEDEKGEVRLEAYRVLERAGNQLKANQFGDALLAVINAAKDEQEDSRFPALMTLQRAVNAENVWYAGKHYRL